MYRVVLFSRRNLPTAGVLNLLLGPVSERPAASTYCHRLDFGKEQHAPMVRHIALRGSLCKDTLA